MNTRDDLEQFWNTETLLENYSLNVLNWPINWLNSTLLISLEDLSFSRCAASPVLKTRLIAARALPPLAKKSQVAEICVQLTTNIPASAHVLSENSAMDRQSTSFLHGSLLQVSFYVILAGVYTFTGFKWQTGGASRGYARGQRSDYFRCSPPSGSVMVAMFKILLDFGLNKSVN